MCGIIGYKGKKQPKEILINGLKNLEYTSLSPVKSNFKGVQTGLTYGR